MIESAYARTPSCEAWLQGIAQAVRPCLDFGMGVQVYAYDVSDSGEFQVVACATAGNAVIDQAGIQALVGGMPPEATLAFYQPAVAHTTRELLPQAESSTGLQLETSMFSALETYGARDVLGVGAGSLDRTGCMITSPSPTAIRVSARFRRTLAHVSAHVAAGYRLRYWTRTSMESADAVLDANGHLLHSDQPDAQADRAALSRFVARRAIARGQLRKEDGERAVEMWKALVEGEWTVVDHLDTDGKRLLFARRNRPAVGDPGALTLRERQVAAYAALGHSVKFVSYELGLSPATVSIHLRNALRKLHLRDRSELSRVIVTTPVE